MDLPNDCIREIIKHSSHVATWLLSQSCKSLRMFRPVGKAVDEFIKDILTESSREITNYYIDTSKVTKDFWNYFLHQVDILAFIGKNCTLEYINWLSSSHHVTKHHKKIIMEFAILRMSKEDLIKTSSKIFNRDPCNRLDYFCYISIDYQHEILGLEMKIPIYAPKMRNWQYHIWCFRHAIIPDFVAKMGCRYLSNDDMEYFFKFKNDKFLEFMELFKSTFPSVRLQKALLYHFQFKYGYKGIVIEDWKFPIAPTFTNINLYTASTYENQYGYGTVKLTIAPYSNNQIINLIRLLICAVNITSESIRIIRNSAFLPWHDELMQLLNVSERKIL